MQDSLPAKPLATATPMQHGSSKRVTHTRRSELNTAGPRTTTNPPGGIFVGDDIVQQILVALARIEERIKAQTEQSEHRHNNLKMAIETFVPRRELDEKFSAIQDHIKDLQSSRARVIGWLAAAWLSGLGLVGGLLLRKF